MARRRKKPSSFVYLFLGAMIVFGLALVGITIFEIPLTDLVTLSILERATGCRADDLECQVSLVGSLGFFTDGRPPLVNLPVSEIDTNSPIMLNFAGEPIRDATNTAFNVPPECEATPPTENIIINLEDGFGNIISALPEGIHDIAPLIQSGQDTIVLRVVVNVCQPNYDDGISSIRYYLTAFPDATAGQAIVTFLQKPPEIREFANPLLSTKELLSDFRDTFVIEKATSFAVAETFQLENPTVITDLVFPMEIARPDARDAQGNRIPIDFQTTITAFVWNMDQSPPERIVQSEETFTGLDSDFDLDFTFPNAVALLPVDSNDQPINYGVGVRVDQNPLQEFGYHQSNQTANTHGCVVDRNSAMNSESTFVPFGICGLEIFHSPFLASTILDEVDIDTPIVDLDPLTREELIALLCEGVSPEPEICQSDTFILNANSCGATEVFFDGSCICAPNYDRNAEGKCQLREVPDLLKIGDFTDEELIIIGLGLLILVAGAVGIAALTRR